MKELNIKIKYSKLIKIAFIMFLIWWISGGVIDNAKAIGELRARVFILESQIKQSLK